MKRKRDTGFLCCVLALCLMLALSGCVGEEALWTAFEALGIPRSILEQCQTRETENGQTEYTLDRNRETLTLRLDGENRVVYLARREKERAASDRLRRPEELLPHLDAIRKAYGAEDYQLRTDLWEEYRKGDKQVTLEYTKAYHGAWNTGESIAFCLDLTSGLLTEYALSQQPPLETALSVTPQEAEKAAREQMEQGAWQPWAEESFLRQEAFARAEVSETKLVFFQRKLAYQVTYTAENAFDPAAFEKNGKAVPQEPVAYGVWIAAGDGAVLHSGPVTEFPADCTVLPLL